MKDIIVILVISNTLVFSSFGIYKINEFYFVERNTVGVVGDTYWECWSCNRIPTGSRRIHLDRKTMGTDRKAWCYTASKSGLGYNEYQSVIFTTKLKTSLGEKYLKYKWIRRGSSLNNFELPMLLPPKGDEIRISTFLYGTHSSWVDYKEKK